MDHKLLTIALALLLSGSLWAECPIGQATVNVPAVVEGQEGGLLSITAYIRPGAGAVFTSVEPNVGKSTQLSQKDAAVAGLTSAGVKLSECDVFFLINDNMAGSVDGPSAGLAMATAVRAAAEGKEIRGDVAITGAISRDGRALEVGGIIDKAQAASRGGMAIMITPSEQVFENIILRSLAEKYNFSAVQVENLSRTYEIATSGADAAFESGFALSFKDAPQNLPKRELDEDEIAFAKIAREINGQLQERVSLADGKLSEYREHFLKEVARNEMVIQAGYPYTAANNAFLSLATADFLSTASEQLDLDGAIGMVGACLRGMPDTPPTVGNYQWLMGARARKAWAQARLDAIIEGAGNFTSSEEKYSAVRELYYARNWCLAGGMAAEEAIGIGGAPLDENALRNISKSDIAELEMELEENQAYDAESYDHLGTAKEAFEKGEYLAALYDTAYANAMHQAALVDINGGSINETWLGFENRRPASLWGKIYWSQAEYIGAESGKLGITSDNSRVALLAKYMDLQSERVGQVLQGAEGATTGNAAIAGFGGKQKSAPGNPLELAAASIMMVAAVAISLEFAKK